MAKVIGKVRPAKVRPAGVIGKAGRSGVGVSRAGEIVRGSARGSGELGRLMFSPGEGERAWRVANWGRMNGAAMGSDASAGERLAALRGEVEGEVRRAFGVYGGLPGHDRGRYGEEEVARAVEGVMGRMDVSWVPFGRDGSPRVYGSDGGARVRSGVWSPRSGRATVFVDGGMGMDEFRARARHEASHVVAAMYPEETAAAYGAVAGELAEVFPPSAAGGSVADLSHGRGEVGAAMGRAAAALARAYPGGVPDGALLDVVPDGFGGVEVRTVWGELGRMGLGDDYTRALDAELVGYAEGMARDLVTGAVTARSLGVARDWARGWRRSFRSLMGSLPTVGVALGLPAV